VKPDLERHHTRLMRYDSAPFTQQEVTRSGGDDVGVQRLTRAVIKESSVWAENERGDFLRDLPEVHSLMPRIDVNRMRIVPKY
jgi:hypothetical protein